MAATTGLHRKHTTMTNAQIYALIFLITATGALIFASYRLGRHDAYIRGFTDGTKASRRISQRFTSSHREPLDHVEKDIVA